MIDILSGGVLGSLLGGAFRLAPELLKWLDRKDERAHELKMFEQQCQLEAARGAQKLAEIGAQREAAIDTGTMAALQSAIQQQADMVTAAGAGWVASLSASVRPVVTYWVLMVWSFAHVWLGYSAWATGLPPVDVFKVIMSPDFAVLVSGTINYWFLDRTLKQRGL